MSAPVHQGSRRIFSPSLRFSVSRDVSVPRDTASCGYSASAPVRVRVGDCAAAAAVNMTRCAGSCASNASAVMAAPFLRSYCRCCKPTSMIKQSIDLHCSA